MWVARRLYSDARQLDDMSTRFDVLKFSNGEEEPHD